MPDACRKLRGEGRPARLALAAERDQRLLARLGLGAGRQHAGRRVARAGAGRAAIEHRRPATPRAASRQAMPSPITPAPMMATLRRFGICVRERSVKRRLPSLA